MNSDVLKIARSHRTNETWRTNFEMFYFRILVQIVKSSQLFNRNLVWLTDFENKEGMITQYEQE